MVGGAFAETSAAALQESQPLQGLAEQAPLLLAREALLLSGAAAVHIYLWDPSGGFLFEAGRAGSSEVPDSLGFPLGDDVGFIFYRVRSGSVPERRRLSRISRQITGRIRTMGAIPRLPLAGAEEATTALISAMRAKSPTTARHCTRVARYAAATALALGLSESGVCHVERCGLLHDIGKLGIADELLEKPTVLSAQEWVKMRLHPSLGVGILQSVRSLASILPAVAMHHERLDGKGYPAAASGSEIPIEARIVNLCDAYDTMTSERPYQRPLAPEEALDRVVKGSGTQFDPNLVELFSREVFPALAGGLLRTQT